MIVIIMIIVIITTMIAITTIVTITVTITIATIMTVIMIIITIMATIMIKIMIMVMIQNFCFCHYLATLRCDSAMENESFHKITYCRLNEPCEHICTNYYGHATRILLGEKIKGKGMTCPKPNGASAQRCRAAQTT